MAAAVDPPVPAELVLKLRGDLSVVPQTIAGQSVYIVEDRVTGKCFRLGRREYDIATLFNGRRSLEQVCRCAGDIGPGEVGPGDVGPGDVLSISRWLVANGLLQSVSEIPVKDHSAGPTVRSGVAFSPIFIKIPLLTPDRLLQRLLPWLDWIHSAYALAAALCLAGCALLVLGQHGDRFRSSAAEVFCLERGVYLLCGWLVLKTVHELGHGLACKRYGAYVREAGIGFLLFAPMPYVDVTSSWRLRSKWARVHIAAAGMYVEAVFGSLAVLIWSQIQNPVAAQCCVDIALMATVTTVLFNANPLMRFDGYYIVSDLLEIPNLDTLGRQSLRSLARRWLLGDRSAVRPTRSPWVLGYAIAVWCWRVTVSVSLVCAAAVMGQGAGIVLAVLAVLAWFLAPLVQSLRSVWRAGRWKAVVRVTVRLGLPLAVVLWLLACTPWPFPRHSPGVVEYQSLHVVRSPLEGFVRAVYVTAGDNVRQGDRILDLDNEQLREELKGLRISVESARLRCRWRRQQGEMAKFQMEADQLAMLEKQLAEKQQLIDQLSITAPADGQILGRQLNTLLGSYTKQGQELCCVGTEDRKEIQLLIDQDDINAFRQLRERPVAVRSPQGLFFARSISLDPRATSEVTHPGLCAPNGGPLPVSTAEPSRAGSSYRLLEPRLLGRLPLAADQSRRMYAGQICTVSARAPDDTILAVLAKKTEAWFADRLRR